jgi:cytochrome c peroxidase
VSPTIDSKIEHVRNGGARLTKEEKRKMIAFLQTLTDSLFISDPKFSDPFVAKKKR